MHQINLKV